MKININMSGCKNCMPLRFVSLDVFLNIIDVTHCTNSNLNFDFEGLNFKIPKIGANFEYLEICNKESHI